MTRIFLEDNELDLSQGLTNQITYAIDDIRNLDSKSTSFTKTIIIPGTANNNRIFGNIFELNNSNFYNTSDPNVLSNFNAMVNAYARIEVDGLVLIKGHLRLLEIIRDGSSIEYECAIIGELGSFVNSLGNLKLEELDFSGYNHNYTADNITQSWEVSGTRGVNNSGGYGSGYFYPLIDYGQNSTNKKDFKLNTFRPSFFVKEYVDKMFEYTDYTYESVFFNTDFFKSLVIPNNQKEFSKKSSTAFYVQNAGDTYTNESGGDVPIAFSTTTTIGNFTANGAYNLFTYNSSTTLTGSLNITIKDDIIYGRPGGIVSFKVLKNGVVIDSQTTTQTTFDLSIVINEVTFNLNDTLQIVWTGPYREDTYYTELTTTSGSITINSVATYVPFNHDEPITVNDTIPKGIFLKDFFTSIMKMFNLIAVEDKYKRNHLIIEPYQNFFTGNILDWSDKLDRSKPFKIKPMSELNARYYNLKYAKDNDFYSENYQKVFNEGYADRVYDTTYEFSKDSEDVNIIFAPSVLVKYNTTDKIYPAIYKLSNNNTTEDRMDSVIRIGMIKKITGVANWHIKKQDGNGNWSGVLNSYGYFGHLNDPNTPTIDLNFGAPLEIFFTNSSYPSDNLFNTYYSGYMYEITNKDSRLITGMFKLNNIDIYNLDFSKLIFLDGGLYKLSKVIDYEADANELTKVELLRIIDKTSSIVDNSAHWDLYGANTCVDCNTYQVYQDTNPYSATYGNYQVNGTDIGATPPTFGSCNNNPTWTSQGYSTCSSCGTYLVYRNTNACSTTYNNYQVNGVDVGPSAPTNGACDVTPDFVSQAYNTCVDCVTYLVYRDTKLCSPTYGNYQVNEVNVGNTAPVSGDCNTEPIYTNQFYYTCSSCGTYLVYKDTNVCSATEGIYRVNGVDIGYTAPTDGACDTTAAWTSQSYNTCVSCVNYLVYRDTNPCSATYNNYRVNGVNIGNTAPTNGDCNTTASWTSQSYNTCVSCVNYLVYRDTNPCSATYNNYRVNGVNVGNTAPVSGDCNTTALYNSNIGLYYVCSSGSVYDYPVYQNTNPCFTGNQYFTNGSSYATNPTNSAPSTSPNWDGQGYTTCISCVTYLVYRDINTCSSTYGNYQVNGVDVGSTAPTSGTCDTNPNWVSQAYSTCVDCELFLVYRDTNVCSPSYNNYRVNGVNVGNTAPSSGACNTSPIYTNQFYYTCTSCNTYLVYRDTNPCSETEGIYRVNGVNVGYTAPTDGECNTTAAWTSQGYTTCVNCVNYLVYLDTNPCSATYNNYRVNGVNVGSTAPVNAPCVTTAAWTSQGYNTCVDCVNYLVYLDTNPCSATYGNYRVNGVNVGSSAPVNAPCNTSAVYNSNVGLLYVCSSGSVLSYAVYANTNTCFTGNQFYANGNSYATNPSNTMPDTTQNWVANGSQYCSGFDLYEPQIQTNPCATNYNGVRDYLIQANSSTCAESYAMSNCLGGGGTTYSATYTIGSFSVGDRVTSSGVTYVITSIISPTSGISITSTGQTGCPEYTQFTDYCTMNIYYILGTGYSSMGTSTDVPDGCLQPTGTTSTPTGTQIYNFTSNPGCECV
jgi:hypothetical protein